MFTIKNRKYALTHNSPHRHLKIAAGGQILLNAGDLRDDLHMAKERYFNDVEATAALLDRLVEHYDREGFLDLVRLQE
jgi:hypothetical protein